MLYLNYDSTGDNCITLYFIEQLAVATDINIFFGVAQIFKGGVAQGGF